MSQKLEPNAQELEICPWSSCGTTAPAKGPCHGVGCVSLLKAEDACVGVRFAHERCFLERIGNKKSHLCSEPATELESLDQKSPVQLPVSWHGAGRVLSQGRGQHGGALLQLVEVELFLLCSQCLPQYLNSYLQEGVGTLGVDGVTCISLA